MYQAADVIVAFPRILQLLSGVPGEGRPWATQCTVCFPGHRDDVWVTTLY